MPTTVFISYSHDDQTHLDWVLQLATRLRSNGLDVLLDRWNLRLGQNLAAFMEQGLSDANRVVCICSEKYVEKANVGSGGVGYEKQIITAELMADLNSNWVVPVIRNNNQDKKVPTFLRGRLFVSFGNDGLYEKNYEELLRELLDQPVLPIPPIGNNPFQTIKSFANQKFLPNIEKYASPATSGEVTFDYSNNNGRYFVGQGELLFELDFSKSSDRCIQLLNDPPGIRTIAIAKGINQITEIEDARTFDGSSRVRRPQIGQVAVIQNANGFYAAIKILAVKDDTRGPHDDEVVFNYVIQSNGSPNFTSIKK